MTTGTMTKSITEKTPKYVRVAENLQRYSDWLRSHSCRVKDIAIAFDVSESTVRKAYEFAQIERPHTPIDEDGAAYNGSQWPLIQSFVLRQSEGSARCLDLLALLATTSFEEMRVADLAPSAQAILEAAKSRRVDWVQRLPRADVPPFVEVD